MELEEASVTADRRRSPAIRKFSIGKYSGVLIFALIILVFGIWTPDTFLTATNFRSILASQAIIAILALG
ncbi:hypothetical protein, partial [Nocardioides sp. GCM10030258]|uniref:hypothetical protein n=1 Tax=unclassified Nocardioides TaxID=2615069 RepID=UPI003621D058